MILNTSLFVLFTALEFTREKHSIQIYILEMSDHLQGVFYHSYIF